MADNSNITKYITLEVLEEFFKQLRGGKYRATANSYGGIKIAADTPDGNNGMTTAQRAVKQNSTGHLYIDLFNVNPGAPANFGSNIQPIYIKDGQPIALTATLGSAKKPIYMNTGELTESTETVGSTKKPIYMKDGELTESNETVGSNKKPIYMNAGELTESNETVGSTKKPIYMKDGELTESNETVGSTKKPIYMNTGELTESTETVGSTKKPIYMKDGELTESNETVGSTKKPIYMKDGELTESNETVGSAKKPIYMNAGELTESNETIGSVTKPIYMNAGVITECDDIVYTSGIDDTNLKMPNAVGGIKANTTVSDLNNKSFSELFDDLLFPTIYPVIPTASPTGSISLKGGFSNNGVYLAGSNAPTAANNFTLSYTPNKVTLNGVVVGDYSGTLNNDSSYIYINNNINNKELPTTIPLGDTTYYWHFEWNAGTYQPVTNKGGDEDENKNKYPKATAGSGNTSKVTINGSKYYYYVNKDNGEFVGKLNKCVVSSGTATISLTKDTVLPSVATLKELANSGKNTDMYLIKSPGLLEELYMKDTFDPRGYSELLDSMEYTINNDGLYCYFYKSGIDKGEVIIYGGKIKFNA